MCCSSRLAAYHYPGTPAGGGTDDDAFIYLKIFYFDLITKIVRLLIRRKEKLVATTGFACYFVPWHATLFAGNAKVLLPVKLNSTIRCA
jgi:hypothetical protein